MNVIIDYVNSQNQRQLRKVRPIGILWYEYGWVLQAHDLEDTSKIKNFLMERIQSWKEEEK